MAKRALEHAVSLAERFGAQLSVLYSVEEGEVVGESAARENLCGWIGEKVQARCALDPIVRHGNAAEQIIAHARQDKADLIVMGAEHRPFLDATFFGKTFFLGGSVSRLGLALQRHLVGGLGCLPDHLVVA